jgi:hypothetical protein
MPTNSVDNGNWVSLDGMGITPVPGLDGDIVVSEIIEDTEQGETSDRSNGTSPARLFIAMDPAKALQDPQQNDLIKKSILGGWWQGKKLVPMQHPYQPAKYATRVDVKLVAPDGGNSAAVGLSGALQAYQRAILNIEFQTLPFTVNSGHNDWMTVSRRATNQRIEGPQGHYQFSAGADSGKVAAPGIFYSYGLTYVDIVVHQISGDTLFPDGTLKSIFDDNTGQINKDPIEDYDKETLLLDSVDLIEFWGDYSQRAASDSIIYAPLVHLVYNPQGWQNSRDSAGAYNRIKFINGGADLWKTFDLATLMQKLEPTFAA